MAMYTPRKPQDPSRRGSSVSGWRIQMARSTGSFHVENAGSDQPAPARGAVTKRGGLGRLSSRPKGIARAKRPTGSHKGLEWAQLETEDVEAR